MITMKNKFSDKKAIAHTGENGCQTLEDHLLNVSKLSGQFAAKIGLEKTGDLLGLMHDLGKYSSDFQDYILTDAGSVHPDQDGDNE